MGRRIAAVLAAGLTLALAGGAQAKAPPDGISLCGKGACVKLAFDQAESLFTSAIFGGNSAEPAAPGPFYLLRWSWEPGSDVTAYYVPGAARIRTTEVGSGGYTYVYWHSVSPSAATTLAAAARGLAPLDVPVPTSVSVGKRVVADPASYLRLFPTGRRATTWAGFGAWWRVHVRSNELSPWTDGWNDVRISRARGYVWIDGTVRKVSKAFASRARRALSLSP